MLIWDSYVALVKANPLVSSAVQVALLGTFGELLGARLRGRGWMPFSVSQLTMKVAVWAFLGVTFKLSFAGFAGFYEALVHKGFWPGWELGLWRAFSISLFTNMLFGPVMMAFHRWTDNLIEKVPSINWTTLQVAWRSLVWFWVPAHTITFALPGHFQVGLAAVWAVVLGVILAMAARKVTPAVRGEVAVRAGSA